MSKVGGALPAWYWPETIPRRTPVPTQTLDRLIKRASSRGAGVPAIVWLDREVSYTALLEQAIADGAAIGGLAPDDEVIAVAETDPGEALMLLLGGLAAGKQVFLLDTTSPPAQLTEQLVEVGASLVLTAGNPGAGGQVADVRVVQRDQLTVPEGGGPKPRATRATASAVIVPFGDELVVHSHSSLAAMAMSLTAFIPDLRDLTLVSPPPLWNWESLTVILAALLNGRTVIVRDLAQLDGTVALPEAYTLLLRSDADAMIEAKSADRALNGLRHVFVSTGYFQSRWRRRLESLCGREVLTVWGSAPVGPAVVAHPTWFPFDAHGIPLVNVRVVPIDPASGEVSLVPWEMLERAEIGIESPSAMNCFVREASTKALGTGKVIRTNVSASVDHVGVVTLHKPKKAGG